MAKKIEKFNVFPDNFPKNIVAIKDKVLCILHKEGMVERGPLMIEGMNLGSVRQSINGLIKQGLIKVHNKYIGLSELGLKRYSDAINTPLPVQITTEQILNFFKQNKDSEVGTKDLLKEIFNGSESNSQMYNLTVKFKVLRKEGVIVQCRSHLNYREYYLADSNKGREFIENNKPKVIGIDPLKRIFQIALPGTLSAEEPKPFFC